jgi:sterol 3beta-glucosyltransferase
LHRHILGAEPVIGAFDEVLSPLPDDALRATVLGYWRNNEAGELPLHVGSFLQAAGGSRAVYVGFGSMAYRASSELVSATARALLNAGFRVVVGRGWSEAAAGIRSSDCLVEDDLPHDLLFPRMAAVIHHGGAGTTTAAAVAGVPQIVIPHLGDQAYHGSRVQELGIGAKAIPLKDASPSAIVGAVQRLVGDAVIVRNAALLGSTLRSREGSASAAERFEGYASGSGD